MVLSLFFMKIKIRVVPNSKKQKIEKLEKEYKVWLKSQAEDGKANVELIKLLKKKFNKQARIINGLRNKNKIVEVL